MVLVRVLWCGLALVAVAFAAGMAASPVRDVSLGCSKSGDLGVSGDQAHWKCDDSIIEVLGVWPPVQLGLALAVPPVVAGLAMRRWLSWLVVASFPVLVFVGLVNWTGFWLSLWFALPMGIVSAAITVVQHLVAAAQRRPMSRSQ